MSTGQRARFSPSSALGTSLRNIRGDDRWLLKVAAGGALVVSVLGLPLAQGFVMESLENIQRGFPSPLPPWELWREKLRAGLMGLLVDFTYFALPLLGVTLLTVCVASLLVMSRSVDGPVGLEATLLLLAPLAIPFALGASPLGKLALARTDGLAAELKAPVREALRGAGWPLYSRARLTTLPAYLPALAALLLLWLTRRLGLPTLIQLGALWLIGSAIFFAHLVVVQVYALAARALQQLEFEARLREQRGGD